MSTPWFTLAGVGFLLFMLELRCNKFLILSPNTKCGWMYASSSNWLFWVILTAQVSIVLSIHFNQCCMCSNAIASNNVYYLGLDFSQLLPCFWDNHVNYEYSLQSFLLTLDLCFHVSLVSPLFSIFWKLAKADENLYDFRLIVNEPNFRPTKKVFIINIINLTKEIWTSNNIRIDWLASFDIFFL